MVFKMESSKEDLITIRKKLNSSFLLSDIGIVIEFVDLSDNGKVISEICCSKFKAEPFKNQWRAIKRIISKYLVQ